jgi:hypothetical protein
MADKMSSDEFQALSSKVAAEVAQRIAAQLAGGALAPKQFVFTCPGAFDCSEDYKCKSFHSVLEEPSTKV